MEIKVEEKDYNGAPWRAEISDSTNKWYANYEFRIIGAGKTKETAIENLKEKYREMVEEINNVIYKV